MVLKLDGLMTSICHQCQSPALVTQLTIRGCDIKVLICYKCMEALLNEFNSLLFHKEKTNE